MGKVNSEIGRTSIDEKVRMRLWAVSGGRCELCNRLLYQDLVFGCDGNFGEMAHIHAVSEGGPRHKYGMTPECFSRTNKRVCYRLERQIRLLR